MLKWILTVLLFAVTPQIALPQTPLAIGGQMASQCLEGRAVRFINGTFGCAPGVAPTLTGCGTGAALSANATDFVGKITTGSGLISSCTLVLSKLYTNPGMGCLVQSNSATALATTPVVGATATNTTIQIPLSISATGATITYVCFPV